MKSHHHIGSRSGIALASAVITVFTAAALVAVLLTMALATNRSSGVTKNNVQAHYLAEGAVEVAKKRIQEALANWSTPPTEGVVQVGGHEVPYTVTDTTEYSSGGFPPAIFDASGIMANLRTYEVTATAVVEDTVARLSRVVMTEEVPIFQFAVFYSDDLEVNPGPNMTLGGRVHSNKNIYLSPNGSTLTVDTNYLRAVGHLYRHRKEAVGASNGTVNVRKWVENPFDPSAPKQFVTLHSKSQMNSFGVPTKSGYDSNFTEGFDAGEDGSYLDLGDFLPFAPGALDYWGPPTGYAKKGHTIKTSDHAISEAVPPEIGSIQMFDEVGVGVGDFMLDAGTGLYEYVGPGNGTHQKGFFHQKAALSFVIAPDGANVIVTGPDGAATTTVTVDDGEGGFATVEKSYADILAGAYQLKHIYDARQAAEGAGTVQVVEIDMGHIMGLLEAGELDLSGAEAPGGGIVIYGAKYGATTGLGTGGVKLVNGAELALPVTVASESPIYVHGDYNVGGATHGKKGAAVIGDAINLLSNNWNDAKTHSSSLPVASDTTFNLAMITGGLPTNSSGYNGGLENLPRFHENWGGKRCTILGSFVNTWTSQLATGKWKYGGKIYTAPIRDFSYDPDFNNMANLPPWTPVAVNAHTAVTW
jgi:hypothetical protein